MAVCANPSRSGGVDRSPFSKLDMAWYIRLFMEFIMSSIRDYNHEGVVSEGTKRAKHTATHQRSVAEMFSK